MNQTEITASVRTGIREPRPKYVSDADITAMTLRGVTALGLEIKESDPSFFRKRAILDSNHYQFTLPSDCMTVEQVWDLTASAKAITGATAATPIVVTSAAHGFSDDDLVIVTGIVGNTTANNLWQVDNVATNTFELKDSVGTVAWSSDGFAVEPSTSFIAMKRKNPMDSTLTDRYRWFPLNEKIVVDYKDFENDILIYYISRPSAITDIPEEFHDGLVSFCVINLMRMPEQADKSYPDKATMMEFHKTMYDVTVSQIMKTLRVSTEAKELYDVMHWDVI